MNQEQRDVRAFHLAMSQDVEPKPTIPIDRIVRLRGALVAEEFFEFIEAMFDYDLGPTKQTVLNCVKHGVISVNLPDMADAIEDMKYVLLGTNLAFGIDGEPLWNAVHDANMRKASGPVSPEGKRLKPPGWTPPDIRQALIDQGWKPPSIADAIPEHVFPELFKDAPIDGDPTKLCGQGCMKNYGHSGSCD